MLVKLSYFTEINIMPQSNYHNALNEHYNTSLYVNSLFASYIHPKHTHTPHTHTHIYIEITVT